MLLRVHVPLQLFNYLTDVHKTWYESHLTLRHHLIILSIPQIHYNKWWTRALVMCDSRFNTKEKLCKSDCIHLFSMVLTINIDFIPIPN
jgi:hypothetical protein